MDTLQDRQERFPQEFVALSEPQNAFGIQISAVPAYGPLPIERVYDRGFKLVAGLNAPLVKVHFGQSLKWETEVRGLGLAWKYMVDGAVWTPEGNGARCSTAHSWERARAHLLITSEGVVEFGWLAVLGSPLDKPGGKYEIDGVFSYESIREFANVLAWADTLRRFAGSDQAQYRVQVAVHVTG